MQFFNNNELYSKRISPHQFMRYLFLFISINDIIIKTKIIFIKDSYLNIDYSPF